MAEAGWPGHAVTQQARTQAHRETRTLRGGTCPGGQKRTQETTENMAVSKGPASPFSCRCPSSLLHQAP